MAVSAMANGKEAGSRLKAGMTKENRLLVLPSASIPSGSERL
jgi:hypothetical protein